MRRIAWCLALSGTCTIGGLARADLPNTAPIYGGDSLESIGAALEQSVSAPRHNDSRDLAERLLRENGDAMSIGAGTTATSLGATMLIGGVGLASSAKWNADCASCLPSVMLVAGGFQLALLGLFSLGDYGGLHIGRHHQRHVDELVRAMSHSSVEAASAARRHRLTLGWSLVASGAVLVGSGVALFAMGHQYGFDDGAREGIAAGSAFVGSWLATFGSGELAAKWTSELAFAPTRGGAMLAYERRW